MANSAALIRQANPGLAVSRRGRRFLEFDLGNGKRQTWLTLEPLHYGAASDQEIDTTWQADTGAWQWRMLAADFQLHARDVLNAGDTVQWLDPESGESVTLQPLALSWVDNATNSRQQITQPQAVTVIVKGPTASDTYVYGSGATVVKADVGDYYVDLDVDEAGFWCTTWSGTGTLIASEHSYFQVRRAC